MATRQHGLKLKKNAFLHHLWRKKPNSLQAFQFLISHPSLKQFTENTNKLCRKIRDSLTIKMGIAQTLPNIQKCQTAWIYTTVLDGCMRKTERIPLWNGIQWRKTCSTSQKGSPRQTGVRESCDSKDKEKKFRSKIDFNGKIFHKKRYRKWTVIRHFSYSKLWNKEV